MTTHATLKEARREAKGVEGLRCIIEINHATQGRCFIKAKAPMTVLANALRAKPMPEILALVKEHDILTPAELKAERETFLREHTKCERCRKGIDGNVSYSQYERFAGHKVRAFYCDTCKALLSAIGAGEYTALQERASDESSIEPHTKED